MQQRRFQIRRLGPFARPARRASLAFAVAALLLVGGAAARGDSIAPGPTAVVEAFHGEIIATMKEAETLGFQGRYDRLKPALERTFDLGFMAEKSIGRHWRKLEPADQEHMRDVFARFTLSTYASRFSGYGGERFETREEQAAPRDTVFVRTRLVRTDGEDSVEINYRLHRSEAGWRVIDVLLRGTVSELALRRSEYSSVIKRDGFPKLIETLEQKIDDLTEGEQDSKS